MACPIYDSIYCKVMTIVICDMQFEDTNVQCILWRKLNATIERKGLSMLTFRGFMVDGGQANWNVVRIVMGLEILQ
jgi:hypothetical protein